MTASYGYETNIICGLIV